MTRKEQARMARLEAENRRLREAVDKHFSVYCQMLHESIELKTKLELIEIALHGEETSCP